MNEGSLKSLIGQRNVRASFCFSLTEGLAESEVLARFGATPAPEEDSLLGEDPLIGVTRAGRWTLALELESSYGADPAIICALSRGTLAVSVHRVLDSHVRLSLAEDGVLLTSLATVPPMTRKGAEPDRLLPVLRQFGLVGEEGTRPKGGDVYAVVEAVRQAYDVPFSERLWQGPFVVGEFTV